MPEVFALTFPTVERYAKKIGAEIRIISERKHSGVSITYEKTQVFDLGKDNEWNILIDADIAISHQLPDVTTIVPRDRIGVHMAYKASQYFPCDLYFTRDSRDIAIAADFMVVHHMCHDIWTPLDDPTKYEIKRPFILDEFCFSRNLAKFGLKFSGVIPDERLIFHLNMTSDDSVIGSNKRKSIDDLKKYVSVYC